jgi:hypothetical protein
MLSPYMNLTYRDHLRWSLDGKSFANREHSHQRFDFRMQINSTTMPWYYELRSGLLQLTEIHGRNLHVFYSGGYDSEIVVRELNRLGVNLTIWTIKFKDGENALDVANVIETCSELGLMSRLKIITVDIKARMESDELKAASQKYQCSQIAYLNVLMEAEKLHEVVIMGGEIYLQKHQRPGPALVESSQWYYVYREDEDGCTYRYSVLNNRPLINEVMSYTPQMISSWLNVPIIRDLIDNRYVGKLVVSSLKAEIFKQAYPYPLTANAKRHGFETLALQNSALQFALKSELPNQEIIYHQLTGPTYAYNR